MENLKIKCALHGFAFQWAFILQIIRKSCNSGCLFPLFRSGEELTITLPDLRPATDYHARYVSGNEILNAFGEMFVTKVLWLREKGVIANILRNILHKIHSCKHSCCHLNSHLSSNFMQISPHCLPYCLLSFLVSLKYKLLSYPLVFCRTRWFMLFLSITSTLLLPTVCLLRWTVFLKN